MASIRTDVRLIPVVPNHNVNKSAAAMALRDVAEEYFSKMNSIANRMYVDMNETKATYEDFWYTLSEAERSQILDESIMKPEICMRYRKTTNDVHNKNEYAIKLVMEDNYTYRDEHSAPFSVRTPSQRNLTIFNSNGEKGKGKRAVVAEEHVRVNLNRAGARNKEGNDTGTLSVEGTVESELPSYQKTEDISRYSLPKTGLDLLDNW